MNSIVLINEFCKIYGVDRGEVDYWTRLGLLHPRVMENGYRDYSGQAEDEVKMISVAQLLDYPGSLESKVQRLYELDDAQWSRIVNELKSKHKRFTMIYNAAFNLASIRSQGGD